MNQQFHLPPVAQTPPQLYCQLAAAQFDDDTLQQVRAASLLAVQQTSNLLRGSGKPFSCHLIGVASLVAENTTDRDVILAALLHALYQPRVSGSGDTGDRRNAVLDAFGPGVERLLHAYHDAGPLLSDNPLPDGASPLQRHVRLLQLADQLEDGLDGGPWWHGEPGDSGEARGCASQRVDLFRSLASAFEEAPGLGAPSLLERYRFILDNWQTRRWPSTLRSGRYTSFRAIIA